MSPLTLWQQLSGYSAERGALNVMSYSILPRMVSVEKLLTPEGRLVTVKNRARNGLCRG